MYCNPGFVPVNLIFDNSFLSKTTRFPPYIIKCLICQNTFKTTKKTHSKQPKNHSKKQKFFHDIDCLQNQCTLPVCPLALLPFLDTAIACLFATVAACLCAAAASPISFVASPMCI